MSKHTAVVEWETNGSGFTGNMLRCGACGGTYGEQHWSALELKERIDAGELGHLVSRWPDGTCIEVRRCSRCGHAVAAKRPQPP